MNAMTAAPTQSRAMTLEHVLIGGDLGKLSAEQRVEYYQKVCNSIGLNPLTRPFEYLTLNNKLTLYARKDCTDQLRNLNKISIAIVSRSIEDGLMTVHVRATDANGRSDEDFGVVSIANLKGEHAANAALKCVTKAKRRVTLSISGLGFLDETEVEDIPAAAKGPVPQPPAARISPPPAPKPQTQELPEEEVRALDRQSMREMSRETDDPPHDPETGEIIEDDKTKVWLLQQIDLADSCDVINDLYGIADNVAKVLKRESRDANLKPLWTTAYTRNSARIQSKPRR